MDRLTLLLTSVALGAGVGTVQMGGVANAAEVAPTAEPKERTLTVQGPVPLPARLTVPSGPGPFPAVVLVHGSGPGDHDQSIGEYRPFRDLAQGLGRRGVAVLRYDKRTQVNPGSKIRTVSDEVIDDARAALKLLAAQKEVDPKRIFLLGYDLGAYLAPRIVADQQVAGAILLGGAARPLWELHVEQVRHLLAADGSLSAEDQRQLKVEQDAARRIHQGHLRPEDTVLLLGQPTPATYWLDLRPYDAVHAAHELSVPLLLLFGDRDEFATARDRELWQKGLVGRPATLTSYPGLNHLFRIATSQGEIADMDRPGPMAGQVVADVASWIVGQWKKQSPGGQR